MEKKSILRLSSVVLVMLMGVLTIAVPSGHAQLVGTVCIQPTTVTNCTTTAPVITGVAGTNVTLNVNINGSDSLGLIGISVVTDPTILNPTSISTTGTVVPGSLLTIVDCINGVPQGGANCNPYDGAGVASLAIASLGALTVPPTTGLLFSITYSILTSTPTPISYVSDPVNCAGQSVAGTNDCVLISAGASTIPESAQTATFNNAQAFDYSLSNNGPVSITPGGSGTVTTTATLTAGSAQGVTLSCVSASLPDGITCGAFTVNPVTPTGSSVLTINVAASVAAGSHTLMVTGSPLGATTTPTTVTVTVTTKDSTSTSVACSPSTIIPTGTSTCTATVTDTATRGATSPTGTVTFSTSGSGSFTPSTPCNLSNSGTNAATCTVSYTPSAVGTGTHNIGAMYSGDTTHQTSTATAFALTVNPGPTGPSPVAGSYGENDPQATTVPTGSYTSTAGDIIVVVAGTMHGPVTFTSSMITDTMGNTYTLITSSNDVGIWTATAKSSGSNTVTFTNSGLSTYYAISVEEYSHASVGTNVNTSSGSGTSLTVVVSGAGSTSLIVGGFISYRTSSISMVNPSVQRQADVLPNLNINEGDLAAANIATLTASLSNSTSWYGAAVELKPSS